jgi:hypothetical protein
MQTATLCNLCRKPIEPDAYGRARRFHPDCRRQWRSQDMEGNQRRKGRLKKPRQYRAGARDAIKTDAYEGCDAATIRRVGCAYWGELADFAYWCYDQINPLCYGGRIKHPLFQFCRVMPYGGCIAQSHVSDLERPVIDVFLSLWTRRKYRKLCHAWIFGVITHEMMHFDSDLRWRDQGGGRYRTSHDNEFWLAGVERVSPFVGADLANGKFPYERWPHECWTDRQWQRLEKSLANRKLEF